MQKAVREGKLELCKIEGALNDADLLTKPLTAQGIDTIMERIGSEEIW